MVVTPCYRLSTLSISNIPDFPVEDFFKVPFTHHSAIISGPKETSARFYYIHRTVEEHLSVKKLRQLIKEDAYHSQGRMPNNFTRTINNPREARRAVEMFKDEYLLDFINVEEIGEREKIDVDERVVEQSIVQNIKNFIMTFGRDFAFIGNQYHLEIYGVEQFPDLLSFNRELKATDFMPEYIGKLNFYCSAIDDTLCREGDNKTIGLLLCKTKDRIKAEYALRDIQKPIGVSDYELGQALPKDFRSSLPSIEEIEKGLNEWNQE